MTLQDTLTEKSTRYIKISWTEKSHHSPGSTNSPQSEWQS